MRSIKIYSALLLMLTISVGCEKEPIDVSEEDAKASDDLSFLEFINSGIDVESYHNSIRAKEQKNSAYNKLQSGLSNADEAYFEEFCDNLPVEDFEEARVGDGLNREFRGPLSENNSNTLRMSASDIEPGLIMTTDATTTIKVLALYGNGFQDSNNTKLISARRDQALVLQFTGENILSVGLDISSFPYPDMGNTQQVTIEVLYASGDKSEETITASIDATFYGFDGDEPIKQIKLSSTNLDAWVGADNIAFGICAGPDSDADGCLDSDDSNDASNMEKTVVIGSSCDSGVLNRMTAACGITLADDVDKFERGEYRNHGALVKEFASLTNLWVSEGLISSEEKGLLMSCAAKAGF